MKKLIILIILILSKLRNNDLKLEITFLWPGGWLDVCL
jgi:hypothetical protein